MANKRGIHLKPETIKEIQQAIARGMSRRDVVKTFDVSYSTYNRYAPHPVKVQRKTATDISKVKEINGAIKLIVEVAEAVRLIVKDNDDVKAENEILKNALAYANTEIARLQASENQRISLKIQTENAIQSLESRE